MESFISRCEKCFTLIVHAMLRGEVDAAVAGGVSVVRCEADPDQQGGAADEGDARKYRYTLPQTLFAAALTATKR